MYFSTLQLPPPYFRQGGRFLVMFLEFKLKMTTSGPVPDNLRRETDPQTSAMLHADRRRPAADRRPPTAADLRGAPRFELHAARKHGPVCPMPGRAEARVTSAGSSGFDVDGNLSIDPACAQVPVAFDSTVQVHISALWLRSRSGATNVPFFSLFPLQRLQKGDVTKS